MARKRNIWIWNHYATSMYKSEGGRHIWFAENLIKHGYRPTIFCASTIHNSSESIDTGESKYAVRAVKNVPFVFLKTPKYKGNGVQRIRNMVVFYKNLFYVSKEYAQLNGKPDVILASSVHPLTLVAGIQISRRLGVPCICEVRDLWPESLVAYGFIKRDGIVAKLLYRGEKWIYKNADAIIMTWEGGKDYIIDKGWGKEIDLKKVIHISNGVMIDEFDRHSVKYRLSDEDLDSGQFKKVVYAGSIRKVNNIGMLLDVAKIIQEKGKRGIKFLIYGTGDELEMLQQRCINEQIDNVVFKGSVDKKYIPYILKRADINILHNTSTILDKYGQSQNKLFEYLAAGKCILQTYTPKYNICQKYECGVSVPIQNANEIAQALLSILDNELMLERMGQNARRAAYDFDYSILTEKLIDTIENL